MTFRHIKYGFLAVVVIAVFGFLSIQSQRVNEELYNQYRADLRQLEGLQASLNEDVLRARLGLLTYYDPLNTTLDELGAVRDRLGQIPAFIDEQGQRDIKSVLEAYDGLMTQKRDYIERFKTQNAVLINSLSYFTIVVSDLASNADAAHIDLSIQGTLNALLQDVLLYNVTVNDALVPGIEGHINRLRENQDVFSTSVSLHDVDVNALINHTNIILERKPITDTLIDQMFALSIPTQLSELSELYQAHYQTARQSASFYQVALYIFSLAGVGYVSISIITRLRKSAAVLNSAKEELQETYGHLEHRSRELEVANTELKTATALALESTRLKSEFMSTMSHELRTPLNAILGFCGIMLEGMGGEIDADARGMLERITANGTRLLNLINQVLDLAKIEAGRMELVSRPVSPRSLAGQWQSQMQALADQKALSFKVDIDPRLPDVLYADSERVTQVAINLLGNAFKFTEHGGVALRVRPENDSWIIEVSDTGAGIPPHAINYIFDEFRQVDGSSKRVYGGSGLGLAIVRNLCLMMKGNVRCTSELGKGSVFTVTLPLIIQEQGFSAALEVA